MNRSFGVTVGRGMLSIATTEAVFAEPLVVPSISISGRVPPNNSLVHLDLQGLVTDVLSWPEFHNGVAAALRIGPKSSQLNANSKQKLSRNWILYNKTASALRTNGDRSHAGIIYGRN